MVNEWKIGDRIQLTGTIVSKCAGGAFIDIIGDGQQPFVTNEQINNAVLVAHVFPKIKVGQYWRTREGHEVAIVAENNDIVYPFRYAEREGNISRMVTKDGFHTNGIHNGTDPFDLVELIKDVEPSMPMSDIKKLMHTTHKNSL